MSATVDSSARHAALAAHDDDDAAVSCQSCGACCAFSADWPRFTMETDAALDLIPHALVADSGGGMRCIGDRCAALDGVVGAATSCRIYALRPDVCRACSPGDEACRMARDRHGLSSLPARLDRDVIAHPGQRLSNRPSE